MNLPYKITLAAKVAELFRSQPGKWIDGRRLANVAGCYGWRTRVSDIRRAPYHMKISNRQRTIRNADGTRYIQSEYCYEPEGSRESAADGVSASPAAV